MITRNLISPTLTITETDGSHTDIHGFVRLIDCWRDWLGERGLKRGDRVIIALHNTASMQALFFACLELGIVFIGTDEKTFFRQQRYCDLDVSLAIVADDILAEARAVLSYLCESPPVFQDLSLRPVRLTVEEEGSEDDFAVMAITSGTTGEPKTILHSHRTIMASVRRGMEFYSPEDRVAFYMNINHLGVLTVFTLPVLLVGCQIQMIYWAVTLDVMYALARRSVDKFLMFEWNWYEILELWKTCTGTEMFFPRRPVVITGGACVHPELIRSYLDHGISEIIVAYGMTEVPPPVIIKRVNTVEGYDLAELGYPMDGWAYRLDETGHLCLRGPSIGFDGDGCTLAQEDGWFVGPDVCDAKRPGIFLKSRGRRIKRNGQTIMLDDLYAVESRFLHLRRLSTCFLVVEHVPDDRLVMVIDGSVSMMDSTPITLANINAKLREVLPPEYSLDHLIILPSLPSNGLKHDYQKIVQIARDLITTELKPEYDLRT